jgi:phenylpropionate dioxygenase-like ring-hydroxylating dioxygenase large terminal subunit
MTSRYVRLGATEEAFLADASDYPLDLTPYWHPVALSEQVTRDPQRVVLLGRPVVLFRADAGVAAFRDLCIHRGARLSLGKVTPEGHLQCPYHGWEYDRSGRCVRIPACAPGTPIPSSAQALSYRTTEAYGLVWICLEEPVAPVPPFPRAEYDDPTWHTFFAFSEEWNTSAARVLENFADWSHIPFVHDGVLGDHELPRANPSEVVEVEDETGFSIRYSYEQLDTSEIYGGGGALSVRREYVIYPPFTAHLYKVRPTGERSLLSLALCPIGPRETKLYLWISRNHDFDRPDDEYRQLSLDVFAQDRAIVETQLPEQIPADLKQELHVKVPDAFSVEFRRVLRRLGATAS